MISFKSKIAVKILNYFFLNPQEERYINELSKILNVDVKNLHSKLKELEKEGLLKSEFRGNQRYFYLNKDFPLLEHYRQIFLKTSGIEYRLKNIIKKIKGMKNAYLFGSYAQNTMETESDIDLLAIGDHSVLELQKKIAKLQHEISREINVVNMSEKEYLEKKKKKDQFVLNIFKDKVINLL